MRFYFVYFVNPRAKIEQRYRLFSEKGIKKPPGKEVDFMFFRNRSVFGVISKKEF